MQSFGVQVPPGIEAVVARALAKQPEQRYQSVGEMAAEFQRAVKQYY
jgi:serine/threonine-protein kinase